MTLKDFLEAINYRITEGSRYYWDCYPDAHQISAEIPLPDDSNYAEIIFSTVDQLVYEVTASDNVNGRYYRWINPDFREAYINEAKRKGFDPDTVFDDEQYTDLEVEEDILEKLEAIATGREYDDRVLIPINISDEDLLAVCKAAHAKDMTLNKFIEHACREAMRGYEPPIKKADDWEFA